MKLSKKLIGIVLAGALALGTGGSLMAMEHEGEGHGDKGGKMMEKLGLSKEAAAKVKEAKKKHRDILRPLNSKRRDLMEKLEDQVEDGAKDAEISETLTQLEAAQKEIQAAHTSHIADLKTLLTPTQQAKMLLGMKKHMGRHMMKHMDENKGEGDDKDDDDHKGHKK